MAFYELEPWGPWRDNYHVARLASLYANANSPKHQRFSLDDFFYKDPDTVKEERHSEIGSGLLQLASMAMEQQGN